MKYVLVSGYFNPLHSGHISYFNEAAKLGDKLIVIINNDEQVKLKGSKPFMNEVERCIIVGSLKNVDRVSLSISNDKSVCADLRYWADVLMTNEIIFANGGDRVLDNVPEVSACKELGIRMVFNVGCEKTQSSSNILKQII